MTCPDNDFKQTLFLGCSVVSFSASAGWNEQSTEVTVELVQDDCASASGDSKAYWDLTLTKQAWTLADPGFLGDPDFGNIDIVGMPCYFRVKDFEFTGIIQSWEKTDNSSGRRYVVKLVSPSNILQTAKLIVGEYAGSVIPPSPYILPSSFTPHNIINIFGYAEAQGLYCPQYSQTAPGFYELGDLGTDGATFGTPAGGFGGSLLNSNGMPWYMIRNIFNILVNATFVLPSHYKFSPHGRLTGKSADIVSFGSPWDNGFGILTADATINGLPTSQYFVDISELPIVPTYFRFNQSEVSLLEAISRVCQEAGYDFYIELLPVSTVAFGGSLVKFIKIRTVSRLTSPVFGIMNNFIDSAQTSGVLVGSSSGREFRNEVNSKFIVGGLKQTLYQAYQDFDPENDGDPIGAPDSDDMILPFFGTNSVGDMIIPRKDVSGFWEFDIETSSIESSLSYASFTGSSITINENELRSVTTPEMWSTYIIEANTDTRQALDSMTGILNFPGTGSGTLYHDAIRYRLDLFKNKGVILPGDKEFKKAARDFSVLSNRAGALVEPIVVGVEADTKIIYSWISSIAEEYYGTKFAVRVPNSCVYTDQESNQLLLSEEPTQDGGWTEVSNVIGLGLNSNELTFFRNDTNKIETIVAYTGFDSLNLDDFNPESYVVANNNVYLRGTVDSEYVFHDSSTFNIPRAIVEIPSLISSGLSGEPPVVFGLVKLASALGLDNIDVQDIQSVYSNVASKGAANVFLDHAFLPGAIAFGLKSNINTYGPWTSIGPVGGMIVEKDDGLVPWEYGNYSNLNSAGIALANSNVTNMQVGEMGSISIVGYPTIPLGAELNSLTTLAGKQLVENRSITTSSYTGTFASGSVTFSEDYITYDYGFNQSGVNGPTVTNINVSVGSEVTTQYQLRTYTPKFGRFARLNADRLKEVNQNRMKYVRDLRSYVRETANAKTRNSINSKSSLRGDVSKLRRPFNKLDKILKLGTPHELFVGRIVQWGEGVKRTIISTSSFNELPTELGSGAYEQKSIGSLETIIRPISLRGAGGLPRLFTPLLDETGTYTGVLSGTDVLTITQVDLNPYINPRSLEPSGLLNRRYNYLDYGDTIGHDFDLVARSNYINPSGGANSGFIDGLPTNGLLMQNGTGNPNDYMHDYRTFALRGPLLLHSWGYDTAGKPIPNQFDNADDIVNSGIYAVTGSGGVPLTGNFMSGFSMRPDTWPVAPVDLRLNRQRGLWEAGGIATIVQCIAQSSSSLKTQDFTANNVEFIQGSDATITGTNVEIQIENTFGWDVTPNIIVIATKPVGKTDYQAWQVEC